MLLLGLGLLIRFIREGSLPRKIPKILTFEAIVVGRQAKRLLRLQ